MSDFTDDYVTEPDLLAAHARLCAAVGALVDAAPPERLRDPTPCGDWDVRRVMSHLVDVNDIYATFAETGGVPEGQPEYDDPRAAYGVHAARAMRAFAAPGFLDEVRDTPLGPQPGAVVVQHVVNELLAHGWDLARGIGAPTDIEPEIAARSLASWRGFFAHFPREQMGFNFAGEADVPEGATAADRVAAYLGRTV